MKLEHEIIDDLAPLMMGEEGDRIWRDVKMFVSQADGEAGLTGEAKKDSVKKSLQVVFSDIGGVLLELAVTIGWAWLKAQEGRQ